MKVSFTKMNGAGNDFILIDNRENELSLSRNQISKLCHRQIGIGADGLIYLCHPKGAGDWAWQFYNADGSEAEMCGNAARCVAALIFAGQRKKTVKTLNSVFKKRQKMFLTR